MEWSEIGKSLLGLAPTLATAIGGPVGMIAGGAISVLTKFLGLDASVTPQVVADSLSKLTPEQYADLRKADLEFKQHLLDSGVKLEEIAGADRKSARDMRTAMHDRFPDILATLVVLCVAYLEYLVFTHTLPAENKDFILRSLGMLEGIVMLIFSFYYGSSSGSSKLKDILGAGK